MDGLVGRGLGDDWSDPLRDLKNGMDELIKELKSKGVLHDRRLEAAFRRVDRGLFVPEELRALAYRDQALPIGPAQTISQPYTVAFMLEQLRVQTGQQVLDIGAGSGWQAALLAELVGLRGRVAAFEIIPEVCAFGRRNLEAFPDLAARIDWRCQSGERGLSAATVPRGGGFDRIIAAAALDAPPTAWREQLKTGGRLVYPAGHSLITETKRGSDDFRREEFPGFVFVPFQFDS